MTLYESHLESTRVALQLQLLRSSRDDGNQYSVALPVAHVVCQIEHFASWCLKILSKGVRADNQEGEVRLYFTSRGRWSFSS